MADEGIKFKLGSIIIFYDLTCRQNYLYTLFFDNKIKHYYSDDFISEPFNMRPGELNSYHLYTEAFIDEV